MPKIVDSNTVTWSESSNELSATVGGDVVVDSVVIDDGGTIGSASASSAIAIDSSGKVGIGTISPGKRLEVADAGDTTVRLRSTDGSDPELSLFSAGVRDFRVAGGSDLKFLRDNTEDMRIDSSGNLLVGATSFGINSTKAHFNKDLNSSSNSNTVTDQNSVVNINGRLGVTNTEGASSLLCLTGNSGQATTPGRLIKGYGGNGATTHCFEVQHDGDVLNTNNSYGSISDERVKQDISDALSSWDDIKNIRIRKYRLKSNVERYANNPNLGDAPYHIGVISQEVETVSPGLISQDLLDDGTPDPDAMKHVKYSVLYMKAVKVLQEAMERIETLEAEVAALKGA